MPSTSRPEYHYDPRDLANWDCRRLDLGLDEDGDHRWEETIITPKGTLHHAGEWNDFTPWETEPLVKNERDFELWDRYLPVPVTADLSKIQETHDRLGDLGIIRSHPFSAGQGSPWQSFCVLAGTQEAIMMALDQPAFVHHALEAILQKNAASDGALARHPRRYGGDGRRGGLEHRHQPDHVQRVLPALR